MGEPNVRLLTALRGKAIALKAMVAVPAEADTFQGWPPMRVADVFNQLTTETAKALPDFANILPKEVEKGGGNDDVADVSYYTLLVLIKDVLAVLNSVIPDGQADHTGRHPERPASGPAT